MQIPTTIRQTTLLYTKNSEVSFFIYLNGRVNLSHKINSILVFFFFVTLATVMLNASVMSYVIKSLRNKGNFFTKFRYKINS